jgi:hypothetical protein
LLVFPPPHYSNFFFSETAEYPNMKCIWHFEDLVSSFSLYVSSVAFHTDMLVLHKKKTASVWKLPSISSLTI